MNIKDSQNFLIDEKLIEKLVGESKIDKHDLVIEIGPGKGIITKILAKNAGEVIAVEIDPILSDSLNGFFKNNKNVKIINENFLNLELPKVPYKVFSNIPFNITSEIINKLYFNKTPPKEAFFVMQKEAALRFLGRGEGTMISLLLKPFFNMEVIYNFEKTDFIPQPGVDTVLFKIMQNPNPIVPVENYQDYENFIIYVLYQQKPTLKSRLNKLFTFKQFYRLSKDLNFNKSTTANGLSLTQWIGLFNYFNIGVSAEKKELVKQAKNLYLDHKTAQNRQERSKTSL